MDNEQRKVLMGILLKLVTDYIEASQYALQKNMIGQKRPKQWIIDNAYDSMSQNAIQQFTLASNPTPNSGGGFNIGTLLASLGMSGEQKDPNNVTDVVGSPVYHDDKGKYNVIDGTKHYLAG